MVILDKLKEEWEAWTSPSFQSKCKPFEVEIRILGTWIGHHEATLDGLLSALVVGKAGIRHFDDRNTHALPVPLKMAWQNEQGLPLWCCNTFKGDGLPQTTIITKPFIPSHVVKKGNYVEVMKGGKVKKGKQMLISQRLGMHKAQMILMPTSTSQVFKANGVGDIEIVRELLDDLCFVGRKKSGTVVGVHVREIDHFEFERPVPVRFRDNGGQRVKIGFTPPYFKRELHEICA